MLKQKIFKIILLLTIYNLTLSYSHSNKGENKMNEEKKQIANSAEEICPLLLGAKIPELKLKDTDNNLFDLNTTFAKKPTILIFYRGGWCPYCNLHLSEIQKIEQKLIDLGYQIIAISPDLPENLQGSIKKHNLSYKLLSDSKMIAAKTFGIAFKLSEDMLAQYKKFGIDLEKSTGEKDNLLPVPSVFIIGTDSIIKFTYVNPDYKIRISAELLLAAAKSVLK